MVCAPTIMQDTHMCTSEEGEARMRQFFDKQNNFAAEEASKALEEGKKAGEEWEEKATEQSTTEKPWSAGGN